MTTECNNTSASPEHLPERTVVENLVFGVTVWAKELRWMLTETGQCWEIHQLKKRLAEEYAALGMHTQKHLEAAPEKSNCSQSADMQRALGQIQFLQDEILRLSEDHAAQATQRLADKKQA